ncbi:MAG: ankyrin repeat domain-containing protein [Planctomycetes bacterium]|nr:ankyrin repeat domain-containing protein [Planctomycetota bacterium]
MDLSTHRLDFRRSMNKSQPTLFARPAAPWFLAALLLCVSGCSDPGKPPGTSPLPASPLSNPGKDAPPAFPPRVHRAHVNDVHRAVKAGDLEAVKRLLAENPRLGEDQDERGCTPLHLALERSEKDDAHAVAIVTELLKQRPPVNVRDTEGRAALHVAVLQHWSAATVQALLDKGASAFVKDDDENTPLNLAAQEGQAELARVLLPHHAQVTAGNAQGKTPIELAYQNGYKDLALGLARNGDLDFSFPMREGNAGFFRTLGALAPEALKATPPDGITHLHVAATSGQTAIAQCLLEAGLDPNARTHPHGQTPLHLAAENDSGAGIVNALAKGGANLLARNAHGLTPLHLAAIRGRTATLVALLKAGTPADPPGGAGAVVRSPLAEAAQFGHAEAAKALLEAGAKPEQAAFGGEDLLLASVRGGSTQLVSLLVEKGLSVRSANAAGETALHLLRVHAAGETPTDDEVGEARGLLTLLLKSGADVKAANKAGDTALHSYAVGMPSSLVACLLDSGAEVNAKDGQGRTPLRCIVGLPGRLETARLLLENGADVQAAGADGQTPLLFAVGWLKLEWARLLLGAKADPNAKDANGRTPLHLAAAQGNAELINLLRKFGAKTDAKDNNGRTPADLAPEAVKGLLK